jgi:uncharacterized protein YkwD
MAAAATSSRPTMARSGSKTMSRSSSKILSRSDSSSSVNTTSSRMVAAPATSKSLWYYSLQEKCSESTQDQDLTHELVNKERVALGLKPFARSQELDSIAYVHVREMAGDEGVFHSVQTLQELKLRLSSKKHVGENVKRGPSIQVMHSDTMADEGCHSRLNILSTKFTEMGVATARDDYGKIYSCQVFRKRRVEKKTPSVAIYPSPTTLYH